MSPESGFASVCPGISPCAANVDSVFSSHTPYARTDVQNATPSAPLSCLQKNVEHTDSLCRQIVQFPCPLSKYGHSSASDLPNACRRLAFRNMSAFRGGESQHGVTPIPNSTLSRTRLLPSAMSARSSDRIAPTR